MTTAERLPLGLRYVLTTGVLLLVVLATLLTVAFIVDRDLFVRGGAVIVASLVGGRMPAVLTGLELGFHSTTIAALLVLINTGWLFIAYPLFVLFSRQLREFKLLGKVFSGTSGRATTQARTVQRLGTWALPVFVWLPFPMTGAVVGAAIGLLLGMPHRRLLYVVVLSMWCGILSWSYGFEQLFDFGGPTGRVACYVITAAIIVYSVVVRVRQVA